VTGITHRIIFVIAIQVQAIGKIVIQVGGVVRADKPMPLGAVISCVAVIQAGVIRTVIATEAKNGCFGGLCFDILILPFSTPAVKKKPPRP
jgi:hypothetical protein